MPRKRVKRARVNGLGYIVMYRRKRPYRGWVANIVRRRRAKRKRRR